MRVDIGHDPGPRRHAGDIVDVRPVEAFPLQQGAGQGVEGDEVLLQQQPGLGVVLQDDAPDFGVDLDRGLLAVILVLREFAAEKDLRHKGFRVVTLNVAKTNQAARRFYERLGYTVVGDDPGRWSYIDQYGERQDVHEPAWRMEKEVF